MFMNKTASVLSTFPGGRIISSTNEYQYNLTDHLGNVRVTSSIEAVHRSEDGFTFAVLLNASNKVL